MSSNSINRINLPQKRKASESSEERILGHEDEEETFGSEDEVKEGQEVPSHHAMRARLWRAKQKKQDDKRKLDVQRMQEENARLSHENRELQHALTLAESGIPGQQQFGRSIHPLLEVSVSCRIDLACLCASALCQNS